MLCKLCIKIYFRDIKSRNYAYFKGCSYVFGKTVDTFIDTSYKCDAPEI